MAARRRRAASGCGSGSGMAVALFFFFVFVVVVVVVPTFVADLSSLVEGLSIPPTTSFYRRRRPGRWSFLVPPTSATSPTATTTDLDDGSTTTAKSAEAEAADADAAVKLALRNLLSIGLHLQDPLLYDPTDWSCACHLSTTTVPSSNVDDDGLQGGELRVTTTRDVTRGEILSLVGFDAIGLRGIDDGGRRGRGSEWVTSASGVGVGKEPSSSSSSSSDDGPGGGFGGGKIKKNKKKNARNKKHPTSAGSQHNTLVRIDVPLLDAMMYPYPAIPSDMRQSLFLEAKVDIEGRTRPVSPGWIGHLVLPTSLDDKREEEGGSGGGGGGAANCIFVPIPGAAPLMCLIATEDIDRGELLLRLPDEEYGLDGNDDLETLCHEIDLKYCDQFADLRTYVEMAYEHQPPLQQTDDNDDGTSSSSSSSSSSEEGKGMKFQHPFQSIDLSYPGLRQLHTDPEICAIDNFLSDEQCDAIIAKTTDHLRACLVKDEATGNVTEDPRRSSTNCNVRRDEVPTVVERIQNVVTGCDVRQLETLQVLRYKDGQRFHPHTDGFEGPVSACGFQQSGRLVTFFVYLNDVPVGGETKFTKLLGSGQVQSVEVKPRKGMAVLHFPNTVGLEEDVRTEHEGSVAVDTKWLLVTWVWKNYRSDVRYDEDVLDRLGGPVI